MKNNYELPKNFNGEIKVETYEYYRHEAGHYKSYFGKLIPKYKNLEGIKCSSTDANAQLSHFTVRLWIISKDDNPVLPLTDKGFDKSNIKDVASIYFPLVIPCNPKEQWKNVKLFDGSFIKGIEESKIIKVNPMKPTEKIINFNAFPLYFGMPCIFTIQLGQQKNSPFVSNLMLSSDPEKQINTDFVEDIENFVDAKLAEAIKDRQQPDTTYTPPSIDLDSAINDFVNF